MKTNLAFVYFSPGNPASFTHANSIQKEIKSLSIKDIQRWLNTQDTYAMHRPARRHFKRRGIIVSGIDEQWQADLADLKSLSRYNKKYRYLLGCIDVFSKYAWVLPLKTKSAQEVLGAFREILKGRRYPKKLQTRYLFV